jgi:hypothetical protein
LGDIRGKRQVALLFALLAGVGLSVYEHTQILQLRKEIESGNSVIFERLEKASSVIEINAHNIQLLRNFSVLRSHLDAEHEFAERTMHNLEDRLIGHESRIHDFCSGISALSQNMPSSFLFKPTALRNALAALSETASKKKLEVVERNPFQYQITHDTQGTMLYIYLHVPLYSETYELYRFVSIPVPVQNDSLFMEHSPRETFLAAQKGDKTKGIIFNSEELRLCEHILPLRMFVCPNREIWQHVFRDTCLGALFRKLTPRVHDLCPAAFARHVEKIIPFGTNKAIVIASRAAEVILSCKDKMFGDRLPINGAAVVSIPIGCKIVLAGTEMQSVEEIAFTTMDIQLSVSPAMEESWGLIEIEHRDFLSDTLLDRMTTVSKQQLLALHQDHLAKRHSEVAFGSWALVLSFVLVFCIIIYIVGYYTWGRFVGANANANPNG